MIRYLGRFAVVTVASLLAFACNSEPTSHSLIGRLARPVQPVRFTSSSSGFPGSRVITIYDQGLTLTFNEQNRTLATSNGDWVTLDNDLASRVGIELQAIVDDEQLEQGLNTDATLWETENPDPYANCDQGGPCQEIRDAKAGRKRSFYWKRSIDSPVGGKDPVGKKEDSDLPRHRFGAIRKETQGSPNSHLPYIRSGPALGMDPAYLTDWTCRGIARGIVGIRQEADRYALTRTYVTSGIIGAVAGAVAGQGIGTTLGSAALGSAGVAYVTIGSLLTTMATNRVQINILGSLWRGLGCRNQQIWVGTYYRVGGGPAPGTPNVGWNWYCQYEVWSISFTGEAGDWYPINVWTCAWEPVLA